MAVSVGGVTSVNLNDSGYYMGVVFRAWKNGDIDRIGFNCTGVNGTVTNKYVARLETVNAGTGIPTGTLAGGSAEEVVTPADAVFTWVTLGTPATVTAGTYYAAIIEGRDPANDPDGSNYMTGNYRGRASLGNVNWNYPFGVMNTGSAARYGDPTVCVSYDDGDVLKGTHAPEGTARSFASDDSPDEYGVLWTPGANCNLIALGLVFKSDVNAVTADLTAYNDETIDATYTLNNLDSDMDAQLTDKVGIFELPSAKSLTSGSPYRFCLRPDTTDNWRILEGHYGDSELRAANTPLIYTSQTNGGGFTDDNTKVASIWPILAEMPAGGGLMTHPGMAGRLVG